MPPLDFALNHRVAPRDGLPALFGLARRLGLGGVEIRNDLPGRPIADGTPAETVRALAAEAGVAILTINALYPFNVWTAERASAARNLIAYAAACGAEGIVMCPLNDAASPMPASERPAALRTALAALKPMLLDAGIMGLVEPLGFPESSLRSKREAVEAIDEVDGGAAFRLLHDTFHHHVAGEAELFPERTGLVHVSGVVDPAIARERMRDPDRVLVDARDRLDNVGQVRALRAGHYRGPLSFEPFAEDDRGPAEIEDALRRSLTFLSAAAARAA